MDTILKPIQWVIAWILRLFHEIFTAIGMPAENGWTWAVAIIAMTMLIRAILIPLFVYQIKAQRKMQLLQPDMQRLREKYKGKRDQYSRQQMAEEQQALFKKHGTNPLASCLPMLVQIPVFFSLFRVIHNVPDIAAGKMGAIGGMTQELAQQMDNATIFGIYLRDTFMSDGLGVKVLTAVMIIIMAATQFITQKQMMSKNMSAQAMDNPFMQQQKMLLYLFPIIFAVGGIYFPLGVLIYWLATNTWTMVQQFIVIRNMPAPGSKAEKEMQARYAKKGRALPKHMQPKAEEEAPVKKGGQRQQPISKNRQKKKKKKK